MLDDVFKTFNDPDGNFIKQFQTTGFDARYFELYLYAYFSRSGYNADRSNRYPDYIVEKNSKKVSIEATTLNPSISGVLFHHGRKIDELNQKIMLITSAMSHALDMGAHFPQKSIKDTGIQYNARICHSL